MAIGTNTIIPSKHENSVAVSSKVQKNDTDQCTSGPFSIGLCADNDITISGRALIVNNVDIMAKSSELEVLVAEQKQ